ncbi:MAG: putative Ig domain-containing protein [Opitutales bacterium]|nr:putative Ig domain-containing protein [Opitutales bacterium]NRA26988.1 cadherin repeat domain-containing protein [Opitutales bacterium]
MFTHLSKLPRHVLSLAIACSIHMTAFGTNLYTPVIEPIENQVIGYEESLFVSIDATDSDPDDMLYYSLDSASIALGMSIGSDGIISWNPTIYELYNTYTVTVTVEDSGDPPFSANESFTVEVIDSGSEGSYGYYPEVYGEYYLYYDENEGAVQLDPSFDFRDGDFDMSGGTLSVYADSGTSEDSVFSLVPSGAISLVGNDVFYDNGEDETFKFGTVNSTSVTGSDLLTVTFNSNVSEEAIDELGLKFKYENTSDNPPPLVNASIEAVDSASNLGSNFIQIEITPINDPPAIAEISNILAKPGDFIEIIPSVTDPDSKDADLSFSFMVSPSDPGFSFNSSTGQLNWVPSTIDVGEFDVLITVVDNAELGESSPSDSTPFTITVNDGVLLLSTAPVVTTDTSLLFTEDGDAVKVSPSFAVADSDFDLGLGQLKVQITNNPSSEDSLFIQDTSDISISGNSVFHQTQQIATFSKNRVSEDEMLVFNFESIVTDIQISDLGRAIFFNSTDDTPPSSKEITFFVYDGAALGSSNFTSLSITPVNDIPSIVEIPDLNLPRNTPIDFNVSVSDPDDSEEDLSFSISVSPSNPGIIIGSNSGRIQFTPDISNVGQTYAITVTVTDDEDGADTETFNLTVQGEITIDPIADQTVLEGNSLSIRANATSAGTVVYTIDSTSLENGFQINTETGVSSPTTLQADRHRHSIRSRSPGSIRPPQT